MKALAFLTTKKGLILLGMAAVLIWRGRARAAPPEDVYRGETGSQPASARVSNYFDEFTGGQRFCYEEGLDESDEYFKRAVSCQEADMFGTVGAYKVRSG